MMNHECCLVMDAWIREAQETTKLVEDIESRIKNKDLAEENRLRDIAQSKLIEAGVKLDRLESLLHNPPSKPALTIEDSEFRWKMISDLQLRTRALALRLYTSTKRAGGFLVSTTTGTSRTTNSLDQDQKRKLHSKFDPELLTLLTAFDTFMLVLLLLAVRGYNPRSSAVQEFWFFYFNKFNQEGVLDLLFDSWSSCTAICLGYNLRSNIIYILCLLVCYYSFLFTTSELQAFSFYQKSPNISFM
ncbi:hypothetical protein POPTR_013G037900v4 [Populus trichocarpa]|uniref:Uncharacterized protein n=1 Tax=Populus trichocarpa TaxID=3694 RepID=B9I8C5_POPTR|nr:hypothetical protein POPTR_013G037900v4 [Populus trichocarpa]